MLAFRPLVAPVLVQALGWLATAALTVLGLAYLIAGEGAWGRTSGLLLLLLAPVAIRVWGEFVLVLFRINDALGDINRASGPKP